MSKAAVGNQPNSGEQDIRRRLDVHRRYHHDAAPDCLQCAAARLVESVSAPPAAPPAGSDPDPRLMALVMVADRARDQLDLVLDLLDRQDGPKVRAALRSIAETITPGDALDTIRARADEARDVVDQLAAANLRLSRISALHTLLAADLRALKSTRRQRTLARAVDRLAHAWYGRAPEDPRAPLT